MKSLNQHAAISCFHIDVAQGSQRHTAAGVEHMQQSSPLSVVSQFLLKSPEDLRSDRFELKAGLVGHATATFHPIMPLASQSVRQQAPFLGQRMVRAQ